jgi:hypothetical protein
VRAKSSKENQRQSNDATRFEEDVSSIDRELRELEELDRMSKMDQSVKELKMKFN